MRAIVTGANRGIGLELTRQLLERGDTVDAAARTPATATALAALAAAHPGRLHVRACDIGSPPSIAAFAAALGDAAVDLLVNNAGVWGGEHQSLRDLDFDEALRTYEVDALGALRLTLAVLPHLRRGQGRKVIHVTSGLGSIADNRSGGFYGYRMAKAALNMASRSLAVDLRAERIVSAVIEPGWVKTDMGGPSASITAEVSVLGMLREIDALTLERSGAFLSWRGGDFPF